MTPSEPVEFAVKVLLATVTFDPLAVGLGAMTPDMPVESTTAVEPSIVKLAAPLVTLG